MQVAGFDWDRGNLAKCAKHGVPHWEIEGLLRAGPAVAPDMAHSSHKQRFVAVGRNAGGRPLFVAFTVRERGGLRLIRPISARYMHKKEIEAYEKKGS